MASDSWVKADTLNDLLGVQPFHFCVGIQFIEVADTQSQIGIGKQLDSLSLGKAHN